MLCPRCGSEAPDWLDRCDNCGLALVETLARLGRQGPYRVGDVVAERYEVRERAVAGPLCWRYLAFDQEDEKLVTLRAVRPTLLPAERDHEAFRSRIEPLLAFDHPGIARWLRLDREGHTSHVVSERIPDGLTLRTLVDLRRHDARAFGAQETIAVLTLVAEALDGAAAISPHGDLNPEAIVIREADLKVEAHGLASALPREETVRALSSAPASAAYLAPEVLDGAPLEARSDVFSLAVIACELLTGRVPPATTTGLEELLGHLPRHADDVLRRCLAPNPIDRDDSALAMVEALAVVLGVDPLRAGQAPGSRVGRTSDPSVAAEPDAEGTQRTLPPMPDESEVGATMPRDPAVPATPAPASETTQKISVDMLEPFEEEPFTPPAAEPDIRRSEATPGSLDVESIRSLGLDPRLVRAARKLDGARSSGKPSDEPEDGPTVRRPAAAPSDDGGHDLAHEDEVDDRDGEDDEDDGVADDDADTVVSGPGREEPITDEIEELQTEVRRAAPSEALEHGEPDLEEVAHDSSPDAEMGPEWNDAEAPVPLSEGQRSRPPGVMPAAFVGSTLGPTVTSVAGTAQQSPVPSARAVHEEPVALPAVVVDDALVEAFGAPDAPRGATARVPRPEPVPPVVARRAPRRRRRGRLDAWLLPILVVGGVAALAAGMALAIWLFE